MRPGGSTIGVNVAYTIRGAKHGNRLLATEVVIISIYVIAPCGAFRHFPPSSGALQTGGSRRVYNGLDIESLQRVIRIVEDDVGI